MNLKVVLLLLFFFCSGGLEITVVGSNLHVVDSPKITAVPVNRPDLEFNGVSVCVSVRSYSFLFLHHTVRKREELTASVSSSGGSKRLD